MKIDEVKSTYDITDVVGRYVALKKKGKEYVGLCPFHDDHKPSMAVVPDKQMYSCPVCQSHGDMVTFVQKIERCTLPEALLKITGEAAAIVADADKPKWVWLQSCADVPALPTRHYSLGAPSMVWRYTDTFYVMRFETKSGKDIRPLTLCTRGGGAPAWRWQGAPTPRPLYNLEALEASLSAVVIVVEGEKTAEWLQQRRPKQVVVTWHGGTSNVQNTDWSPLRGRTVLFFPDHDALGWAAMHVASLLIGEHENGEVIKSPSSASRAWDCADSEWSSEQCQGWVKANRTVFNDVSDCPRWADGDRAVRYEMHGKVAYTIIGDKTYACEEPAAVSSAVPTVVAAKPPTKHGNEFFALLGYDRRGFHFWAKEARLVKTLSEGQFTKSMLMSIAPLSYWSSMYPAKSKFDADAAIDNLIRLQYKVGVFDDRRIRGCGAWREDDKFIIHTGTRLLVDGQYRELNEYESEYIYEVSRSIDIFKGTAITKSQGREFIDMLRQVNWERSVNAQLLAGWCVVAPICGALDWRPHVWITGGAGTGKTWIMSEIVTRLLGGAAIALQGESTEAGIRQRVGSDAMPVIFDEAEAEDKNSIDRIEKILNLMRIASSESDAVMLKGTSGHEAKEFHVRSCFLFASIIYQARKQADLTRVSVLGLRRPVEGSRDQFERLRTEQVRVMSKEFCGGFHARTLRLLPKIIEAIEVFAKVGAEILKSQRIADQLAPLCAGAWMLCSDDIPTHDQADRWMRQQDWESESSLEEERDERQCLAALLEHTVRVEMGDYGKEHERQVGELIGMVLGGGYLPSDVTRAGDRLARLGIKPDGGGFYVSNTSKQIRGVLRGTQWEKNHGKVLQRVDGARCVDPMYFTSAHTSRAVWLPFALEK